MRFISGRPRMEPIWAGYLREGKMGKSFGMRVQRFTADIKY